MKSLMLTFNGTWTGRLIRYIDVDGVTQEHHQAITGFAFVINGGAVLWGLKKQELVTLSIAEFKYITATYAVKEALWLHQLIGEIFQPLMHPIVL